MANSPSLAAEFEQIVYGSDTAARDAAKREVFAAAGFPVWNDLPAKGSRDEKWCRMQRAIERRLGHLEKLIPPPLTYERFTARISEHARRCGVSPGSASIAVIEQLSKQELSLLIEELDGEFPGPSDAAGPEAIRSHAVEAGFSPEDEGYTEEHLKIRGDRMSDAEFKQFLESAFQAYRAVAKPGASLYVCHSSSWQREFENALEVAGFEVWA
jgi:hypothetical protein